METPRPGTLVRGKSPTTGREYTGWLRGPHPQHRINGLWIVDSPKWTGDPEHMPTSQALVVEISPIEGKELEDIMIEDLAKRVLDSGLNRDEAAKDIVRTKKISRAKADGLLDAALATEKQARRKDTRSVTAKPSSKRAEKVEPAVFAALRDELHMSNKQCSAALAEFINPTTGNPMGNTLSRVTELTHSKGASAATFALVEQAWRRWAEAHKVELGLDPSSNVSGEKS